MSGSCERGFTLIEVLIALTIVAVTFTFLMDSLSSAFKRYETSEKLFDDLIRFDSKLKLGNYEKFEVQRRSMPDFPRIIEERYTYKGLEIFKYRLK